MCRMVIFSGLCIRCGAPYAVPELAQRVSCLEAKNNGGFGDCRRGVNYDQHDPALECGPCSSAMGLLDGGSGSGDELLLAAGGGSVASSTSSRSTSSGGKGGKGSSSSSSGGGGGGAGYDTSKRRRVR